MRLIIMGPPGVGKGSLASDLTKHYHIPHISTGEMFRAEIKKGSPVGKLVQNQINAGKFVNDSLTNDIVRIRLQARDVKEGFLMDGYPRNLRQAEDFDHILMQYGWTVDYVIYLDSPEDVILDRITGRRVCPTCGSTYHVRNNKPKVEGICDKDQTPLVQRPDDTVAITKERLVIYHDQTQPIIEYYRSKGNIITIDGRGSIEEVSRRVIEELDGKK
ncbi:adenylate kinase [Acholeplasma vituli]|uniref:Adenylate kinase n=1 Tax=Paracholeplasma vituli TaxID=69473 RepID=A0ABT2PUY9_9MOLU|nr:adenylate kinase [Paracholeplasma vituli]MCU0104251.1 adenylate kinase [Paracholeplasma vituli]